MKSTNFLVHTLLCLFLLNSCQDKPAEPKKDSSKAEPFFVWKHPDSTGVTFRNSVSEDENINYIKFEGVYNGAGVAIGDINNDGLADIYFGGNGTEDKLYLNLGDFKFQDITQSSGIGGSTLGWSTGINMVDINADGWLDIYVCRSGPYTNPVVKRNKLFINNQNNTFSERAEEYGLASEEQSRHTAFFDYDLDGDLDMYLMNQPPLGFRAGEFFQYLNRIKSKELVSDHFYENVDGKFIEKTREAGLESFGYGHNVAVSDINDDGYPDFHKTHDFDDPDFLFYNRGNKTFENKINDYFKHISWSSMGNDFADFNNDGMMDLLALEMAPDDHVRSKVNMKAMDPIKFHALADNEQQHQYMFNTLQLNNGNNSFSEIAQIAGIAKTDWSWACLFFDVDFDGNKDLFISNGIKKDFVNRDLTTKGKQKAQELGRAINYYELQDLMPSTISDNIFYKNQGDLTFKKSTKEWMDRYTFNSNGVALGDLDNDGDLDMVTNNMEDRASVFENRAANGLGGNYLKFKLKGSDKNPFAIGAKIRFKIGDEIHVQELFNTRGYLSSMNYELVFGIAENEVIDRVEIIWPDRTVSYLNNARANSTYELDYRQESRVAYSPDNRKETYLKSIDPRDLGISFQHRENEFDDYQEQVLLPYSQSMHGPFIAAADVNGDQLEDFYVGGAKDQPGELYIGQPGGTFKKQISGTWENDALYEDLGVLFFDSDGDGDQDLYVVSGGTEHAPNHLNYQDRLYINDGRGNFSKKASALPRFTTSGQVVKSADVDGDGDLDLFVGGRIIPNKYPAAPSSHILINNGGSFEDKTQELAPYLLQHSMISDALFLDYDQDGDADLITAGEWSMIDFHKNDGGNFSLDPRPGLEKSRGLWFSLNQADVDGDGDVDLIAGNLGLNSKFKANNKKDFHVYAADFDNSGTFDIVLSSTYKGNLVPVRGRECSSEQMPFIAERFETFQEFAEADLGDILGTRNLENALHYELDLFESVWVENLGNGNFQLRALPNAAQLGPLQSVELIDLDKDGKSELICVGNHYNVEVETVRYDASIGATLTFNGELKALNQLKTGLYADGDAKSSVVIGNYLIITNNNAAPQVYEIN